MIDKHAMREEFRVLRRRAAQKNADAAVQLLEVFHKECWPKLDWQENTIVAGYVAIGSEIDPAPILKFLATNYIPTALPLMRGAEDPLDFYPYQIGDRLSADNPHKIPQPNEHQMRITPQVFFVPLWAFDRTGNRLGSGFGYYDRTLAAARAKNKSTLAIGLAYAEQEVAQIPAEPHDQRLNIIVTPREVIYCPDP